MREDDEQQFICIFLSEIFQVCYYINNSMCNWCGWLQNVADFIRRNDHLLFAICRESELREPADILDLYHYSASKKISPNHKSLQY